MVPDSSILPEDQVTLVCLPADLAMLRLRGTIYRFCGKCTKRVMVAPSGQQLLKKHPDARIICTGCLPPGASGGQLAPGALEEIAHGVTEPNLDRQRN